MLYVLDLDDTLFLEKDFVKSGFKAVDVWLASHSVLRSFFDTAWQLFEKGCRRNIFDKVFEENKIPYETNLIQTLVHVYRDHKPDISLLPDSVEFLGRKRRSNLALITDGYSNTQWKKIEVLKLQRYFNKIIVTGDWGKQFWKPHPRAFEEVSNGLENRDCLYIADNPVKDFIAPQKLGWWTSIRVKRKGSLHYNTPTPSNCSELVVLTDPLI